MESEFGDRFLQFLELPGLLDWLDVVSGAKHLYPTVQCDFKLVLERLSQLDFKVQLVCLASTFSCACFVFEESSCIAIRLRRSVCI